MTKENVENKDTESPEHLKIFLFILILNFAAIRRRKLPAALKIYVRQYIHVQ